MSVEKAQDDKEVRECRGGGDREDGERNLVCTGLETPTAQIEDGWATLWGTGCPVGDAPQSWVLVLTLQLRALVAFALSPGGTDAPAAVFLLGEARQRVAATLEG